MDAYVLPAQERICSILVGILLIGCTSTTMADMVPLRIEWLDVWNVSEITDGQGTYQANTDVEMKANGNVPTVKAEARVEGEGSGAAEVRFSRQFRVVLDDAPAVPVQLQGDVLDGRLKIENTWGGDKGEVDFHAKAGVEGTPIQYDREWHHKNDEVSLSFNDTIVVDGALAANQPYTLSGYAYALGDSDLGHTGHQYSARGTLSLPDPIVITDPIADYYYDVAWGNPWSWTSQGDAQGIGVLDIYTDILGNIIGGFWGDLANEGLDAYFEASGSAEYIEGHFINADGESYVYARGKYGGHAWINVESERDFSLIPVTDALARLRFDGILSGDLFSDGASSAVSLAEVSISGTGLASSANRSVSNGETASVQQDITAWGLAELNQIYTFEGLLRLDSVASAGSLGAYADFLSSFEGQLTVAPVPLPAGSILGMIGIATAGGILRRRKDRGN